MKKQPSDVFMVRQSHFTLSLFAVFWGLLLLMSGIHMGLLILANTRGWSNLTQTMIPLVYWALVALLLALYTRWRVQRTYEEPMQELARATAKVAQGDFSVYVPPLHTTDKLDYLDVMIADFNKMVEELGSIETLKTDFFSNVSHEFKTPLAVIQNNAELLQKGIGSKQQQQEYTQNILQAAHRLAGLITNMLKLNKLEKQVIQPLPQRYDVSAQICECALQFEDMWEKKDITFDVDIEERAMIEADEGLLELVWTNLLSNAMKFTPAGGTIRMTQTSDDERITVCISDTGCGMDANTMKHIFEKFYQGDTSHSTVGNGLGLALVQRILQLSDGTITVQSTPGKGSAFTVSLPVSLSEKEGK
ncbi:MAG: HAMP domain-containing sensor histidine kinase [Lachnospiraceae bacterium]|nr:HAMP domain-containing sensor histidine kinase [Lachnospiraceae bacterium]